LLSLALFSPSLTARADGTDDQYVKIYSTIQDADIYENNGQANMALTKYVEAQTALQRFQKLYPEWNVKVVNYRLGYVASKNTPLPPRAPPPPPAPAPPAPAKASATSATASQHPAPSESDNQISSLREQVRELQADKILLEAKLKESLSAQPSTIDPR